jgi:hypothetical protein
MVAQRYIFLSDEAAPAIAPLLDFFGRLEAKSLLETERGGVLARVISEQLGGERKSA